MLEQFVTLSPSETESSYAQPSALALPGNCFDCRYSNDTLQSVVISSLLHVQLCQVHLNIYKSTIFISCIFKSCSFIVFCSAIQSAIFTCCIFMCCSLVCHFHIMRVHVVHFLCPLLSTPTVFHVVHNCFVIIYSLVVYNYCNMFDCRPNTNSILTVTADVCSGGRRWVMPNADKSGHKGGGKFLSVILWGCPLWISPWQVFMCTKHRCTSDWNSGGGAWRDLL